MDTDLQWAIGIAIPFFAAFIGILVGVFRSFSTKIGALHTRVDDVKEKYVRRDDLDGHLQRMDKKMDDLSAEMGRNHQQVIDVLTRRNS